tara:strand:+ start:1989 stop:2411 length:423 start_codon:yes stop_codon:yes gene_type:complete
MTYNIHQRGLTPYNYDLPKKQLQENTQVRDSRIDEYLQGYFGDSLTEGVSEDDVIVAFAELLETAKTIEEYCIAEGLMGKVGKALGSGAKKVGKALVSDKAKKIYKKTATVAANTVGAAARGVADTAKTGYQSARRETGI